MGVNFDVITLLNKALENGISVFREEEKLKFKVAKNTVVDPAIIDLLKDNKSEIIAFLSDGMGQVNEIRTLGENITAFERDLIEHIPLSYSQERLWFVDQLEGSIPYHLATVLRLKKALDQTVLEAALSDLVDRHEVLRTVIRTEKGVAFQKIMPVDNWQLQYSEGHDFKDTKYLHDFSKEEINRPFDLSQDYMFRAHLVKCADEDHVLILVVHHIAADGWSLSILVKDLVAFYHARQEKLEATLERLPIQYADYAVWQRKQLSQDSLRKHLAWWTEYLNDLEPLELPTDFPRPSVQSTRGENYYFEISKALTQQLKALSLTFDKTLFMTLLAAFKVLLYRYTGQEDICVGTPQANRGRKEIEPLVGFFINTLALRNQLGENLTFAEFLDQIKRNTLAAFSHQDVPFEQVVQQLETERSLDRSPIFQVMFAMQNTPDVPKLELGDLSLSPEPIEQNQSMFDLTFSVTESSDGLQVEILYARDLFKPERIQKLVEHFEELLKSIVANPREKVSALPFLKDAERQQLILDFNKTEAIYPEDQTLVELFEKQVSQQPHQIALVFEGENLSYQELDEQSNQLACFLQKQGASGPIGICLDRSLEMIIGILGILKIGGAYVPIEPSYPRERIKFLMEDMDIQVLLCSQSNRFLFDGLQTVQQLVMEEVWPEVQKEKIETLSHAAKAKDLAYAMYTSGSTGRPKGVLICHQSIVRLIFNPSLDFLDQHSVLYQFAPLAFDASTFEIWGALLKGGKLVISNPEKKALTEITADLQRQKVNTLWLTAGLFHLAVETCMELFSGLKYILAGGDSIYPESIKKLLSEYSNLLFINGYGPTESTTFAVLNPINSPEKVRSDLNIIGRPIGNTKAYVLTPNTTELSPLGCWGELCLSGPGLALAYQGLPDLTREKFIGNPFHQGAFSRLYRTGDLVRWLADGTLEFLGRKDNQIKIRGFRVELDETQAILKDCPLVSQCVVVAHTATNGSSQLVAYWVPANPEATGNKEAIRDYLRDQLPDYMIPELLMELSELPLTANGKVDKRALPVPDIATLATRQFVAPRNEMEQTLAEIWENLLDAEQVGVLENFFEIGGHSLLAMRLISIIREVLQQELKVKDIFTYPTIEGLAHYLKNRQMDESLPPLTATARPEKIPLSYSQERLWFIDQFEGSTQYHQPSVLRLEKGLNKGALELAIASLIQRHEVLRTVIKSENGEPYQVVMPIDQWKMAYSEVEAGQKEEGFTDFIQSEISRPFDLSADYMLRAHLRKNASDDHLLILVMHHIASDGWSQSILVKDLMELYRATIKQKEPNLIKLPLQYADYAIWQRKHLAGKLLESQLDWWSEQLRGVEPLKLPTDFQRPSKQSIRGANYGFRIEKTLKDQLKNYSLKSGSSLFMTLLAVFKVLLYRYSGQEDICVGIPLANRNRREVEALVGFFINTIALRTEVNPKSTFATLLEQVKSTTLSAFNHQDVPFEQIVDRIESNRNLDRSPIFQAMFVMQNIPEIPNFELDGMQLSSEANGMSRSLFDLKFSVVESPRGLQVDVEYCSDLFKPDTIERMAGHFQTLLNSVVASPDQPIAHLPMLTPKEERQLLHEFNTSSVPYPKDKTIIDLFTDQYLQTPERKALVYKERALTYRELHEQTNRLASYLRSKGVDQGTMVAICMEDSLDIVLSILGILKAGGTYIPLDHQNPAERINFILDHTGAGYVISSSAHSSLIMERAGLDIILFDLHWDQIAIASPDDFPSNLTPESLIYVIHTSGSTGKPKGVMLSHRNVVDHLYGFFSRVEFRASRTFAVVSTMSADLANTVLFGALISGGTIHLISKEVYTDADRTHDYFRRHSIDFMKLVPSHWRALENKEGILVTNRTIVFGGEVLSVEILEKIKAVKPQLEVINHYGPTEVTIGKVCYRVDFDAIPDKTPIGRPFCNAKVYVVDKNMALCPIGVPGELLIGGDGVSKGYINRPDLTAERYIQDPFSDDPNCLVYRSGDAIRWLPDGNLDFLERVDDQIKIRGYRIELGEIVAVLQQAPSVSQAVVQAPLDANGHKRLVAYVVPNGDLDRTAIKEYLRSQLPDYMVPAILVELEKIPLNANGKIDRKALPNPDDLDLITTEYQEARTPTEEKLAAIWKRMLKVEKVGIHDNFFELGGHSLLAMRVISAIREEFSISISVVKIFQLLSLAPLAEYIDLVRGEEEPANEEVFDLEDL